MKTKRIENREIENLRISSLPTRPTAPKSLGGVGYTSKEMKEAFDKLPLFIIERFNTLLEDVALVGEDSLAASIPTGIRENHTLSNLFGDIKSGELASYLTVFGESLFTGIANMRSDIDDINKKLEEKEDSPDA